MFGIVVEAVPETFVKGSHNSFNGIEFKVLDCRKKGKLKSKLLKGTIKELQWSSCMDQTRKRKMYCQ